MKRILIGEEWEADCIFVGAHAFDDGQPHTLGGLASVAVNLAHCTVEIVRSGVRRMAPPALTQFQPAQPSHVH